ncbi:hypothetical protein [Polyangium sp. 6x1]|uniref:hypothetical protein n=1 Tax=Polyangium sp. 6x1 TaxID=3042689 RepID=UPI002482FB12|nr:hypothetical protein [Polyangium sp. 6x1]MDI1445998.1 hypothetical protein [Polyangium sp. 6x1]
MRSFSILAFVALAVPVIGCGSSSDGIFASGGTPGAGGSGGGAGGAGGAGGGAGGSGGAGGGCDTQSCNEPPPAACADGSTVITYESQGACSDGSCSYPSSTTPCDAPPPPACNDDGSLRTYSSAGTCTDGACSYEPMDADCGAAGCCEDHCCELEPSNADTLGQLEQTGLVISAPQGTFDTSTGCITPSVLGDCKVVVPAGSPEVCVCRADELTISSLTIEGKRALAIFATRSVAVGAIHVMPGAGTGWTYENSDETSASGGSYGTTGGNPGAATTQGTPAIVPLTGGMNGQRSDNSGGLGGGALQISAGQMITIDIGINAGGGGGRPGWGGSSGGAGGGSGGAILLEAPSILMKGTLSANGGGGGGGSSNNHGSGTVGGAGWGTTAAPGGSGTDGWGCALNGYTVGGDGGKGSAGDSNGQYGQDGDSVFGCLGGAEYVGMGGGGGGAGRIRINTLNGCNCSGATSASVSIGTVVLK